jgi:hypothetical protein
MSEIEQAQADKYPALVEAATAALNRMRAVKKAYNYGVLSRTLNIMMNEQIYQLAQAIDGGTAKERADG